MYNTSVSPTVLTTALLSSLLSITTLGWRRLPICRRKCSRSSSNFVSCSASDFLQLSICEQNILGVFSWGTKGWGSRPLKFENMILTYGLGWWPGHVPTTWGWFWVHAWRVKYCLGTKKGKKRFFWILGSVFFAFYVISEIHIYFDSESFRQIHWKM